MSLPTRVAVDPVANVLYVSEIDGKKIRHYDLDTQQSSIFVNFNSRITDLNVGPDGSVYFIAMDDRTVRRVPRDWNGTGTPEIVAGQAGVTCTSSAVPSCGDGGPATSASLVFWEYSGIAISQDGSLYIATSSQRNTSPGHTVGHRIRWVDAATGIIHTVAGTGSYGSSGDGGQATSARLNFPRGIIALDSDGSLYSLYIADTNNHRIRKVWPNGIITTVAGTGNGYYSGGYSGDGGQATSARLNFPRGIALDSDGSLYIADAGNLRVRRLEMQLRPVAEPSSWSNTDPVNINPSGAADTYPSEIVVSGVNGTLNNVRVTLYGLSHDNLNDLAILVQAPDGQTTMLMDTIGYYESVTDITITFSDAASEMIGNGSITSGTFIPSGSNGPPPPAPLLLIFGYNHTHTAHRIYGEGAGA